VNTTVSEQQINVDLKTTSTWLLIAFFLGWGALLIRLAIQTIGAHLEMPSLRSNIYSGLGYQTGTAFIWTLAWLTGGFLFGFIFGIPKVVAATTSTNDKVINDQAKQVSPKLKVNTNLEDISDWLTKVLVGATLTQIVKVPSAVARAAEFMSGGDAGHSLSFNAALLLYYSALGFLSGYILTRMFFARAFSFADQGPELSQEAAQTLDSANVSFGRTVAKLNETSSLRKAALASDAVPITESLSGEDALRLAKGATLTGDAARAVAASKLAVQKNSEDPEALLTYAWSLRNLGAGLETVIPILQTAASKLSKSSDPSVLSSVYASLAYLCLYQPPPTGYEAALRALDEYDVKGGRPDPDVEVNRACAFAQEYSYLRNSAEQAESLKKQLEDAREAALASIRKALALDPSTAVRLRELLWVSGDPQDNDLAVFQNDAAFTTLLPRT
jgi:hypothetical protein